MKTRRLFKSWLSSLALVASGMLIGCGGGLDTEGSVTDVDGNTQRFVEVSADEFNEIREQAGYPPTGEMMVPYKASSEGRWLCAGTSEADRLCAWIGDGIEARYQVIVHRPQLVYLNHVLKRERRVFNPELRREINRRSLHRDPGTYFKAPLVNEINISPDLASHVID